MKEDKSKIEEKDKSKIEEKDKYNKQLITAFLSLSVIGLFCTTIGIYLQSKGWSQITTFTITGIGTTLLTVGIISLINEFFLRITFLNSVETIFGKIIDDKMPARYKNLKRAGVLDSYMRLSVSKVVKKLKRAEGCDIFFLKMWISNIDEIDNILLECVKLRNCTVKILLLDPEADDAISKRASALKHRNKNYIKTSIEQNIQTIKSIIDNLDECEKKRFLFKTHTSFVSVSLIGIGEELTMGLYLKNKLSTQGMQIRFTGATRSHYQQLKTHFDSEWEIATDFDFESRFKEEQ